MRLLNSKVATREEEEYKGIDSVNIIYITIGIFNLQILFIEYVKYITFKVIHIKIVWGPS